MVIPNMKSTVNRVLTVAQNPQLLGWFGLVCGIYYSAAIMAHPLTDWLGNYRPAALGLFSGELYSVNVFNPAYFYVLLYPLALLPERLGNALVAAIGAAVLIYTANRLGAKPWLTTAIVLMPQNLFVMLNGSIDWLITLGYVLPPQIGLLLVMAKPQLGVGVAIYWFFDAWQTGGIRKVFTWFWPVGVAYGLSFLAYGWQGVGVGRFSLILSGAVGHPTHLWPYALPVGLGLLALAVRHKRLGWAALASPLMAPYTASYTMPFAVVLGLLPDTIPTAIAVVGWIAVLILTGHP